MTCFGGLYQVGGVGGLGVFADKLVETRWLWLLLSFFFSQRFRREKEPESSVLLLSRWPALAPPLSPALLLALPRHATAYLL